MAFWEGVVLGGFVCLFLIKTDLADFHFSKVNEKPVVSRRGLAPSPSFARTKTMGS